MRWRPWLLESMDRGSRVDQLLLLQAGESRAASSFTARPKCRLRLEEHELERRAPLVRRIPRDVRGVRKRRPGRHRRPAPLVRRSVGAHDREALVLNSEDSVTRALQAQIDGMQAADYDRSDVLESRVEILNGVTALYRSHFSRHRSDSSDRLALVAPG